MYSAANRDPAHFDDPETLRRDPQPEPPPRVRLRHPLLPGRLAGTPGDPDLLRGAAARRVDSDPRSPRARSWRCRTRSCTGCVPPWWIEPLRAIIARRRGVGRPEATARTPGVRSPIWLSVSSTITGRPSESTGGHSPSDPPDGSPVRANSPMRRAWRQRAPADASAPTKTCRRWSSTRSNTNGISIACDAPIMPPNAGLPHAHRYWHTSARAPPGHRPRGHAGMRNTRSVSSAHSSSLTEMSPGCSRQVARSRHRDRPPPTRSACGGLPRRPAAGWHQGEELPLLGVGARSAGQHRPPTPAAIAASGSVGTRCTVGDRAERQERERVPAALDHRLRITDAFGRHGRMSGEQLARALRRAAPRRSSSRPCP